MKNWSRFFNWIGGGIFFLIIPVLNANDTINYQQILTIGYEESYEIIERSHKARKILYLDWMDQMELESDAKTLVQQFFLYQAALDAIEKSAEIELLKVRYQRGIELIKLLYEKILSLDHHFAGMRTYQNILLLSNPHSYPDFEQAQDVIEQKLGKKNALSLPSILNTNPFMTATFSVVATLIGDGDAKTKQQDLDKISCILDFTVRMSADLGVIQHETEYLRTANQQLRLACEDLFEDYVKVINYYVPLENCRNNDDWETLARQLDAFIDQLLSLPPGQAYFENNANNLRAMVDLEFATQRVADFINAYNQFVVQSTQYYQKFDNIITAYAHEDDCQNQLPSQFEELKYDIKSTIEKFNNTYNLPEIQGSRMKNLLYGNID